jgi:hypothetical protein
MLPDSAELVQFASDIDGDLHLFPSNLDEPDYQMRWRVWVIHSDGTRSEAPLCSPIMCVNEGVVTNPYGATGLQSVPGWWVDELNVTEIEISNGAGPAIRMQHPRQGT